MGKMKELIIKAAIAHYEAQIEVHKVNMELLLQNPVGVAEHPDIMETVDTELAKLAEADDKLEMLKKHFT